MNSISEVTPWTPETSGLSTTSSYIGLSMGSEYTYNQAVRTGALPVGRAYRGSGSNARDAASENVAQEVGPDVDARDGQQHRSG